MDKNVIAILKDATVDIFDTGALWTQKLEMYYMGHKSKSLVTAVQKTNLLGVIFEGLSPKEIISVASSLEDNTGLFKFVENGVEMSEKRVYASAFITRLKLKDLENYFLECLNALPGWKMPDIETIAKKGCERYPVEYKCWFLLHRANLRLELLIKYLEHKGLDIIKAAEL